MGPVASPVPMPTERTLYYLKNAVRSKILTDKVGKKESCDQIFALPNRPKRAKSRDKTAGTLFTRAYSLVKFSQTKRCFFSFL